MGARHSILPVLAIAILSAGESLAGQHSSAAAMLMRAPSFCMGCATTTGKVISGDDAFISVLRGEDAISQLQAVFVDGNWQAKMYALAGLREIDHQRFERNLKRIEQSSFSVVLVLTEDPHSILRERGKTVLKSLQDGQYRSFVQWARIGRVSR